MSEVKIAYDSRYPSVDDLRKKAKKRIPKFAFEYLDGGCNEDVNLDRNRRDLQQVELMPQYLSDKRGSDMRTELFGHTYDAPFGIAPVGLQGLMWPGAPDILAKAAFKHNVPFVLSTVTTSSIERAAELTEGRAWFQLYHPVDTKLRDDLLKRAADVEMPVLVILADVPVFGHRPRDIRNGLSMPPKMSISNIMQAFGRPSWALNTLIKGQPNFETLKPYMPKNLDLSQLGKFMNDTFSGWLSEERIAPIRDQWKGKLVIKGVVNESDAEKAVKLGLDGIIVSNHGGRQLDAGQSSIVPLAALAPKFKDKLKVMVDSGLRGGPDIARAMASGADFTFMGRSFMYGVSALGKKGGDHTISLLKTELDQVMQQVCCHRVEDFPNHLIK
ncbi:alpha-hydroxy-acid oxidizing protein [Reichenbachiella carrageenanivorans]|uniref:Alpha-hydroxy-acid oxidizing protein n=1 Tax=Reichenbachiella carrageenanivorans TaxID=2979869 RepID=A0ABY6D109_9BACT|nr:alpha-hydroxy acid oxidase [Reichenbachiella carrageenanivorans]UXX79861.1 alpha-hydroxy-acid oxidizing protein [Reichenbachiella carrageenanivorans]